MASYLDYINKARRHMGMSPLGATDLTNSNGTSLKWLAACEEAIREIHSSSTDWDFATPFVDASTSTGNSTLTQTSGQTTWNPQLIDDIWVVDTDNTLKAPLDMVTSKTGEILSRQMSTPGEPLFYYVVENTVKMIPAPDQVYSLRVYYQVELPDVTNATATGSISVNKDLEHALVTGISAYFRRDIGDPQWRDNEQLFFKRLKTAMKRNKLTAKKKGLRSFRFQSNPRSGRFLGR
jgi:hypothetical protein